MMMMMMLFLIRHDAFLHWQSAGSRLFMKTAVRFNAAPCTGWLVSLRTACVPICAIDLMSFIGMQVSVSKLRKVHELWPSVTDCFIKHNRCSRGDKKLDPCISTRLSWWGLSIDLCCLYAWWWFLPIPLNRNIFMISLWWYFVGLCLLGHYFHCISLVGFHDKKKLDQHIFYWFFINFKRVHLLPKKNERSSFSSHAHPLGRQEGKKIFW